jgi:Squalene-hopene cyclase C-terminal domain/Putative Ig domain/Peptidase family M23
MNTKKLLKSSLVIFLVATILSQGFLLWPRENTTALANSLIFPNFLLPYDKNAGVIKWSGGPHEFSNLRTQDTYPQGIGSGLDFVGGETYSFCNNECSFIVRSMAEGDVIYAGPGSFGTQVAIKHTIGGSVIIYGHLYDIWPGIEDTYNKGGIYHVYPGSTIGHAGKTGTKDVHLHVELRDGSSTCTNHCVQPNGLGGDPVGWHSKVVGDYRIFEYRESETDIARAFNYDGVAVRTDISPLVVDYEGFVYQDPDYYNDPPNPPIQRTVFTWLPPDFQCSSSTDCEDNSLHPGVRFAGNGLLGGGAFLYSSYLASINQGIGFLRDRHKLYPNGSWANNVGITGLATLAILNYGYDESDPDVQSAVQYLLSAVKPDGSIYFDYSHRTYETSMAVIALKATQNSAYTDEIAGARDWLVSSQWDEQNIWGSVSQNSWYWGGFGYGNSARPDMSNTQFALLALDAANLSKTDSTWSKAVKFVSRSQNRQASNEGYSYYNDGGFLYQPSITGCLSPGCASYGGATGAGIWGLALAGLTPSDPRFAAALNWVENNYSWDYNPLTGNSWGNNSLYYYYLSMSKALSMARKTRVGTHDWYQELGNKLTALQRNDGSWVNSNSWLYENVPELATSYALLALQTRNLPVGADLELVIILHSPADLHLYDAFGQHVGKNYITGLIDREIPGSSYSEIDPQTIRVHPPNAGNYHLELVGTGDGPWQLEIIGYQDGSQVSYASYTGEVQIGGALATDLNVGAFEGGLTIFSTQPAVAAVMMVEPYTLNLSGQGGVTLQTTFTTSETGNGANIQGVSIFASDLSDNQGHVIPGNNISFSPTTFDIPPGGNQSVEVTIPIPEGLPENVYEGTITVESLNAGTKSIQLFVEVITNLPPVLRVPTEVLTQYSDSLSFSVAATDPNDPGESLTFSASSLPNPLSLSDNGDGTATVSGIFSAAPGTYDVEITVTDPRGLSDMQSVSVVVNQEDALATYTGPLFVSTGCTDCSTATIPLRATIQDITAVMGDPLYDPYPGDITNAMVTFVNRDNANAVLCSANVILIDPANPTVGTATCEWNADIGNNAGLDFTIGTVVDGYYTRNDSDDDTLLMVSKPGSNLVTGGGYFINQKSSGKYQGDQGRKTNLGLNFKFNKKLTNILGRVTIIVRQADHVYKIKSTALSSLVVIPYDSNLPHSGIAELLGKATIEDVTDPYNPLPLEGNAVLNVTMKDNGEPGSNDLIGISVWSKNGDLLYSSNWNGVKTVQHVLDGGNLQVH